MDNHCVWQNLVRIGSSIYEILMRSVRKICFKTMHGQCNAKSLCGICACIVQPCVVICPGADAEFVDRGTPTKSSTGGGHLGEYLRYDLFQTITEMGSRHQIVPIRCTYVCVVKALVSFIVF